MFVCVRTLWLTWSCETGSLCCLLPVFSSVVHDWKLFKELAERFTYLRCRYQLRCIYMSTDEDKTHLEIKVKENLSWCTYVRKINQTQSPSDAFIPKSCTTEVSCSYTWTLNFSLDVVFYFIFFFLFHLSLQNQEIEFTCDLCIQVSGCCVLLSMLFTTFTLCKTITLMFIRAFWDNY